MEPVNISICNQKGGIGKSTFTVLLASYLHYTLGHDILVVDCDYPQWSIHAQRERELAVVEHSDYYKLMMVRQFKATGRKLWPLLKCMPPEVPEEVERIRQNGYLPRIILYDLPGTVNTGGVIRILSSLDAVFIPLKADKLVMESSLTFARGIEHGFVQDKDTSLQAAHLFWTMIDRRERTPLYDQYEAIIRKLGLSLMATHVPSDRNSIRSCCPTARVSVVRRSWLRSAPSPAKRRSRHWRQKSSKSLKYDNYGQETQNRSRRRTHASDDRRTGASYLESRPANFR